MSGSTPPPERILCDTSFVAASAKRSARPNQFAHWLNETVGRLDAAILAISVITLAEARYGYLNAAWGASRIAREERRLAGFLQIPLDLLIIDEWARLKVLSRRNGWNLARQRRLDCRYRERAGPRARHVRWRPSSDRRFQSRGAASSSLAVIQQTMAHRGLENSCWPFFRRVSA